MQIHFIPPPASRPSLIGRIIGFILAVVFAVVAIMFSAVLLVVVGFALLVLGIYVWWRLRKVRQVMAQMQQAARAATGRADTMEEKDVVEGEVIRVHKEDH